MSHGELPERSHLVQPRQILLFGNTRWTAFARTVVIGPYLHISCQGATSDPYLDNGLAEQSVRLSVPEQSSCGKDRMDQRDCCPGSTRDRSSQIKDTRTRHHEQAFEDREEAVGERGRGEKGRRIELWALLGASGCEEGRVLKEGLPTFGPSFILLSKAPSGTSV
jgi:hypothetical protein